MGYKDDLDAAHARIRALERELAEAHGPLATPAPDAEVRPRRPRPAGALLLVLVLPLLALPALLLRQPLAWLMLAVLAATLLAVVVALRALTEIARPSELWAVSGTRGVRLLTGRRFVRAPVLEMATHLPLSAMLIEGTTRELHTRGGGPVALDWYLIASVSGEQAVARLAVERFLGVTPAQLERRARAAEGSVTVTLLAAGLAIYGVVACLVLVKALHRRAAADEILVVTGSPPVRFRAGHLQLPLLEIVDRLELTPIALVLELPGREGRLVARARLSVKIGRDPDALAKASRLLLDLSRSERTRLVERVVGCAARGVIRAAWLPEEVEQIARQIGEESELQLRRLGLELEGLQLEPI
jgi:uncharacterized membrane protein YqiK